MEAEGGAEAGGRCGVEGVRWTEAGMGTEVLAGAFPVVTAGRLGEAFAVVPVVTLLGAFAVVLVGELRAVFTEGPGGNPGEVFADVPVEELVVGWPVRCTDRGARAAMTGGRTAGRAMGRAKGREAAEAAEALWTVCV